MSDSVFKKALTEAFANIKAQIQNELNNEEFDWDFFISMFLKEDSPLVHVFSSQTLKFAELYQVAAKMASIADEISESIEE